MAHNLRKFSDDKRGTVDGRPYGGGAGMVLLFRPIEKAVAKVTLRRKIPQGLRDKNRSRIILLSAKGKLFTQKDARRLAKYDRLVLICGRYEGVDERVARHIADEEISVGEYVLLGGEVPAMAVIEAVSRLIPGVVAKEESTKHESFSKEFVREYPQYTRPETIKIQGKPFRSNASGSRTKSSKSLRVPKVLLSGDHEKIAEWRKKHSH